MPGMSGVKKILVVDDSPHLREFYQLLLRKLNYLPVVAGSGEEALSFIAGAHESFALVVLDLLMPGKPGWDTLMQIRQTPGYVAVPVIVITGMELPADQVARLREHCQAVVLKSEFTVKHLQELLRRLLGE